MAPLDPWIIEEIKKQEGEKRRREEEQRREQPTVPADDPREMPDRRDDRRPDPGYEMPSQDDPKRDERSGDKEESGRGVTTIDIGGGGNRDDEEDSGTIDIPKAPAILPENEGEKRPE